MSQQANALSEARRRSSCIPRRGSGRMKAPDQFNHYFVAFNRTRLDMQSFFDASRLDPMQATSWQSPEASRRGQC